MSNTAPLYLDSMMQGQAGAHLDMTPAVIVTGNVITDPQAPANVQYVEFGGLVVHPLSGATKLFNKDMIAGYVSAIPPVAPPAGATIIVAGIAMMDRGVPLPRSLDGSDFNLQYGSDVYGPGTECRVMREGTIWAICDGTVLQMNNEVSPRQVAFNLTTGRLCMPGAGAINLGTSQFITGPITTGKKDRYGQPQIIVGVRLSGLPTEIEVPAP